MCVSAPEAINYIHVILNLYNQLNKFVAFRNVMKLSMYGCGFVTKHVVTETKVIRLCYRRKVVSFTERVVLTAVHE